MSERTGDRDDEKARTGEAAAAAGAAKARLVFGDPLERQTSDDTDQGWGGPAGGGGNGGRERGLDWYLSQRPPHHGD
ncbi:hypothetical protein [Kitasatospora terrestris]|uniref:Uncharacterized protein n=1 Tax=Kitasatospora terrestris TaxID=258051 RepID=A0ABP9DVZ3_9ACTN